MRRSQIAALVVLAGLTGGSLLITGGYAWYVRSAAYREYCANLLSDSLGLPAAVGQVVPRSRSAREFRDIRVWLPDYRDQVANVDVAVLEYLSDTPDPNAYTIRLRGGYTEISTRTWLQQDYRRLLESGLRPVFDPEGPRSVTFSGMELRLEREDFQLLLEEAHGSVSFEDAHLGRAAVLCRQINGYRPADEVSVSCAFSPLSWGVQLESLVLTVPEVPLRVLRLEKLTDLPLANGSFDGQLRYRERDTLRELTVAGRLFELPLADLTAGRFEPAWEGRAARVELEELVLVNGQPQRLRFSAVLDDVRLGHVLAPVGLPDAGGQTVLRIQSAELSPVGIERLVLSAVCERVNLGELSRAAGSGEISGIARLEITDLVIQHNRLDTLELELRVLDEPDVPKYIDRALLQTALKQLLGISLPEYFPLPERIEYTALGVQLSVRDERLFVFGTHGADDKTILTVRVFGRDFPAVQEPEQAYDLREPLEALRQALRDYLARHWPAWEALPTPPTLDTQPVGPIP